MSRSRTLVTLILAFVVAFVMPQPVAHALGTIKFTTLHQFGNNKSALIQAYDGNLYGTTESDGAYGGGSIYECTPAGVMTTLFSFGGTAGHSPTAALVQGTDGNLYGTTLDGGTSGNGTVFEITPNGLMTTLYSFNGLDGAHPYGALIQATDGNFYGTTVAGGSTYTSTDEGDGTVFRMTPSGTVTTLHSFIGTDGSLPYAGLLQGTNGLLYGTTYSGGPVNCEGTFYSIDSSGTFSMLKSFSLTGNLYAPFTLPVQGNDGNFYGTTIQGGEYDSGAVYKITDDGTMSTLYNFSQNDPENYTALQLGADGNLYGATYDGLFSLSLTGTYAQLSAFDSIVRTTIVETRDGNLYGTEYPVYAEADGQANGSLFKLTSSGISTVASFDSAGGSIAASPVVEASDGLLYGTTDYGGANNEGTVYTLSPSVSFSTVYSFNLSSGAFPSPLIQGSDGNLYGTTSDGPSGLGNDAIYSITPSGTVTTLYSFDLPYNDNLSALVQDSSGFLYGTSTVYGSSGQNTAFKLTLSDPSITLYSVGNDGAVLSPLLLSSDGNLYGTIGTDASFNDGSVYRLTPTGNLTSLYAFDREAGGGLAGPIGNLIQAQNGDIFGTTSGIGDNGYANPTFYELNTDGDLAVLKSFAYGSGTSLYAGLTQANDGNFYSVTANSAIEITPSGSLTTLHVFKGYDGDTLQSSLIQGQDGKLYGTSEGQSFYLSQFSQGTIFSLDLGLPPLGTPPPTYPFGLHLISSPFDYTGASLDTLFGYTGVKLAVWSAATGGYSITPTAPADAIHPGAGYWARFPAAETFANVGQMADTTVPFTINLAQGWNMIGDPFLLSVPLSATTYGTSAVSYAAASTGANPLIRAGVYGYSSSSNEYVAGSTLQPFAGYWIYANSATTMNVSYP